MCVTKTERLITFFLVQHSERLHQLMFGTLHQSQPSFAFFLKRSAQTKKKNGYSYSITMSFSHRCKHVSIRLNYTETGVQAVTLWHNNKSPIGKNYFWRGTMALERTSHSHTFMTTTAL